MLKNETELKCPCCFNVVKPDIVYFSKKLEAYRCIKCGIAFPK